MQTIILRIKNYIESLTSDELKIFYDKNFQIDISNSPLGDDYYKTSLIDLICYGYEEYKSQLILNQDAAHKELLDYNPTKEDIQIQYLKNNYQIFTDQELIEMVKNKYEIIEPIDEKKLIETIRIQLENLNEKDHRIYYYYEFYKALKFKKEKDVVEKFNSIGLRNPYLTHFIKFEEIEDFIFEIIKSGIYIQMISVLNIIDIGFDDRITSEIFINFINPKEKENYDGRPNVMQIEIDLKNNLRRKKYSSSSPRPNSLIDILINRENENYTNAMNQIDFEFKYDFFEMIIDRINYRGATLKELLLDLLNPIVKSIGRTKSLKLFKPFFYMLFEDNHNGLLTEKGFELENLNNIEFNGAYRGNYNAYFSTRIKTLVGI